jgi:hypothetical protein
MRHAMTHAKLRRQSIAIHAMARLERTFWIVDPGMDDAAIARTGRHAQFRQAFDKENILPACGNGMRDGASHRAASDN